MHLIRGRFSIRLSHALGRQPDRAVILAVEVTDVRPGPGLPAAVEAALPQVLAAAAAELSGAGGGGLAQAGSEARQVTPPQPPRSPRLPQPSRSASVI